MQGQAHFEKEFFSQQQQNPLKIHAEIHFHTFLIFSI